jgi:hypothetical protein
MSIDTTPKELCDLGVCTSMAEARSLIEIIAWHPDGSAARRVADRREIAALKARIAKESILPEWCELLQAERQVMVKGMAMMCEFMHHQDTCLSLNGDKNTCDCGMSLALMVAMNPHMNITPAKEDGE